MPTTAKERVYRPQRSFDDDLVDLAGFFGVNQLVFDGLDSARLLALGTEQRDERAEKGRTLGAYQASQEAFIRNQAKRHGAYMQALEHARTKFRNDSAKLKELNRFRRHLTRSGNGNGNGSARIEPAPAIAPTPT